MIDQPVKLIIFDFGGVLGSDSDLWQKEFRPLVKLTGLSRQELNRIMMDKYWSKIAVGKGDMKDVFEEISQKSTKPVKVAKLLEIYFACVKSNRPLLNYCRRLKRQGFRLVILSNETASGMRNKISKFGLRKVFSRIYCSAFLGMKKPQAPIYRYLVKREKIKRGDLVYFIDNSPRNFPAAEKLGFKCHAFVKLLTLKKYLNL